MIMFAYLHIIFWISNKVYYILDQQQSLDPVKFKISSELSIDFQVLEYFWTGLPYLCKNSLSLHSRYISTWQVRCIRGVDELLCVLILFRIGWYRHNNYIDFKLNSILKLAKGNLQSSHAEPTILKKLWTRLDSLWVGNSSKPQNASKLRLGLNTCVPFWFHKRFLKDASCFLWAGKRAVSEHMCYDRLVNYKVKSSKSDQTDGRETNDV